MTNAVAKVEDGTKLPDFSENPSLKALQLVDHYPMVWRLADAFYRAGMIPDAYAKERGSMLPEEKQKSRVAIGIMKGLEVGIAPITALSTIAPINNRPCVWGDGAVALIQRGGKVEWIKERFEGEPYKPNWTAICEIKRAGQDTPYIGRFDWATATKAKLTTKPGPWMSYPVRMMQMRAKAYAIRDGFSDDLCGLGIAEEVQDIPVQQEPVSADFLDDDGDDAAAIEDHSNEPAQDAEQQPAEKPKADPEDWAQKFIDAVNACQTVDDVNALHTKHKAVLDRYASDYADTYERMRDAEDTRIEQLSQDAA